VRSFVLILLAAGMMQGQEPDLGNLALEELLDMQVSSVSRKAQRVVKSPAAVYVITQEEIRRSGATVLADLFRVVPGMNVGELNGASWAISARGSQRQLANKLLVLVDGRSVYNNYFGGTYWHMQDVPLENIDRVEVIRGPGAVMWGSNAVNGVINIITMKASATGGELLSVVTGTRDTAITTARAGGKLGSRGSYRIYGRGRWREIAGHGDTMLYPNFFRSSLEQLLGPVPLWFAAERTAHEDWRSAQGGFRYDWENESGKSLVVSADVQAGQSGIPYGRLSLTTMRPEFGREGDQYSSGSALVRYAKSPNGNEETAYQFWYDRQATDLVGTIHTVDGEYQKRWLAREQHEMFLTLGARGIFDATAPKLPGLRLNPAQFNRSLYSAVLRDDWQIRPDRWMLSAGLRMEHNTYTGWEWQPSMRLAYTPGANRTLWVGASRAVRLPTRLERGMEYTMRDVLRGIPLEQRVEGNENFQAEQVYTLETGYRYQSGNRWMVDATVFENRYSRVWSLETLPAVLTPRGLLQRITSTNNAGGSTRGVEVSAAWMGGSKWKLMGGYAWLEQDLGRARNNAGTPWGESPRHGGNVRLFLQPTRGLQWDNSLYAASSLPKEALPGYVRWDSRLSWRMSRRYELTLTGQDLANSGRVEFYPDTLSFAGRTRRAFVVGLQTRW
jgi:iron complex outermembrane recepter protein